MANRLVLELIADSNPLLKSLEQSQRQLNSFIKSSESAGQIIGGGVNRALDIFAGLAKGGGAAAGVLAGGFVAAAVSSTALVEHAGKQAEALEQLSQKTGISTGTIQQWSVIMAQSNLGADTLTRGVKQLSEQIIQARNPNTQAAETFSELGITATSVNGVIEQVADHFVGMADGADKTRLAVTLFGKAGQDLIPTLNQGAAGFRESMEASKQLGAVLSQSTLHALSSADDAFDRLGVATNAASNQLAGVLAPAVTTVTNLLTDGVSVLARYFQALNEGVSKGNSSSSGFSKWAEILKAVIAPTLGTIAQQHLKAVRDKMDDIANRTEDIGVLADAHVQDLLRQGAIQEDMGKRILVDLLAKWRLITAEQRAQEALGRSVNAIAERERADRNADFARQIQQQEEVNNLQFEPNKPSQAILAHQAAVENLIRLMPELNHHEAALLALHNQEQAAKSHREVTEQLKNKNKELEMGLEMSKADFQLQQAFYSQAPGLIGQADEARRKGFIVLQEENDMRRRVIDETIFDEERKGAAIYALDQELQAKRIGLLNQFPTFWEQQLNAIVSSNAFSLSSITSNFNTATAQWMQGQGNFADFWKQTQTTLLTSALQLTEQWLVQLALSQLKEIAMVTTQEATKTAIQVAGDASRVTSNATANAAMEASNIASATASTSIWGSAVDGISGFFGMIGSGFSAVAGSLVETVIAAGTFIMTVLSAVAEALSATVFGIPFAGAIVVGIGLIAAALAMTDNLPAFAHGGIMTGPTIGKFAEAGSAEAAIPLNDRGARFMQSVMGFGGGSGTQQINLYIDGRKMTSKLVRHMPDVVHLKLGYT